MADSDRITTIEQKLSAIGSILTGSPTNTPGTGAPTPPTYPADVFGPNWKVTTPWYRPGSKEILEITQPMLAKYEDSSFFVGSDGRVHFIVHHGSAHTEHSLNGRYELREMDGSKLAAWDPTKGSHHFALEGAALALTPVTGTTVVGQIHNDKDDVYTFRVTKDKIYQTLGNNTTHTLLDPAYQVGETYAFDWLISGGKITTLYNGGVIAASEEMPLKDFPGPWYFRGGAYLQSNSKTAPDESTTSFTEIALTAVTAEHS